MRQVHALFATFLVTLLALPVNAAVVLPDSPLVTGARVPPNILFILDDSGSMAFDAMPADSISGWQGRAYPHNTIYYNPAKTYQPWVKADGSLMTGGTSYGDVYASFNLVGGVNTTIDLSNSSSCRRYNKNNDATSDVLSSGGTQVCGGTQTFYVPKDLSDTSSTYLGNQKNFWRYQIHPDGVIIRSDYGPRTGSSFPYNRGLDNRGCSTGTGDDFRNCTVALPATRDATAEKANYATWFSYHRTRMKAAKAGASAAFNDLGTGVRVGFRTIWERNGSVTTGNWPRQAVPIPVQYNDGLFDDVVISGNNYDNRTKWYSRLHGAIGNNGTPLHGALDKAGRYFSSNAVDGPYGPQVIANQISCRKNFSILTTDGFWNNDSNYPNKVGNSDDTAGSTITHATTGATFSYSPGAPYRDSWGGANGTLADVAMEYWKTDLRTDLINNVPTSTANPAFWQHMVTFGLSIGLKGNTGFTSVADVPSNFTGWQDPTDSEDADRIDDLLHAAVNSRGGFIAASDPDEFSSGLTAALATIIERTGSSSNVAANSTSLDAGTRVFQANYVSGQWTGQLSAFPIVETIVNGKKVYTLNPVASWQASAGIPTSGRKVFSHNGTAGTLFPSGATAAQLTALTRLTPYPVSGSDNAAYIAGDRSLEMANVGGTLRNRPHLLGDIVGSSPAYSNHTDTIFVSANDGMLHAINALDGKEHFAYIPGIVEWGNLRELSNPEYLHKFMVDGPVVVSTHLQTPGENILVGTLGKGGKGLFALDVSIPSTFSATNVLWERSETPGANMGYIHNRPIITRLNDNTQVLIVGNDINSTNGHAVLLVYNLKTGALIREIDTGVGGDNGLTGVSGWDSDGNGSVDYVYGGDLRGNVWKVDLRSTTPLSWNVLNFGNPLFSAVDSLGNRQSITGGVTVAMHPQSYRPWVFVGTGRFLETGDLTDKSVQSYYAFVDEGATIQRSDLTQRSIYLAGTKDVPVRTFEPKAPLPLNSKGWFLDLLQPPSPGTAEGERVVTEGQVVGDVLVFSSVIPTADACQSDGRGYLNAIDAFTGTSTGPSFFDVNNDGKFDDEILTDGGGNEVPIGSVDLGVGMPTLPGLLRGLAAVSGSAGGTGSVGTRESRNVGRVSWREVIRE